MQLAKEGACVAARVIFDCLLRWSIMTFRLFLFAFLFFGFSLCSMEMKKGEKKTCREFQKISLRTADWKKKRKERIVRLQEEVAELFTEEEVDELFTEDKEPKKNIENTLSKAVEVRDFSWWTEEERNESSISDESITDYEADTDDGEEDCCLNLLKRFCKSLCDSTLQDGCVHSFEDFSGLARE